VYVWTEIRKRAQMAFGGGNWQALSLPAPEWDAPAS
jgi:hypothetical protein